MSKKCWILETLQIYEPEGLWQITHVQLYLGLKSIEGSEEFFIWYLYRYLSYLQGK